MIRFGTLGAALITPRALVYPCIDEPRAAIRAIAAAFDIPVTDPDNIRIKMLKSTMEFPGGVIAKTSGDMRRHTAFRKMQPRVFIQEIL